MKTEIATVEAQSTIPLNRNTYECPVEAANSSQKYKAVSEHLCCDLNGEAVILSMKTGKYYGLNQVGARIWELVQAPISASAIENAILAEYNVAAELCRQEVKTFLSTMTKEGLIELVCLTEAEASKSLAYSRDKIF